MLFVQTVGFVLLIIILWVTYAFVGNIALAIIAGLFSAFVIVWWVRKLKKYL